MVRQTPSFIVVALVLLAAGVAAANNLFNRAPAGLTGSGTTTTGTLMAQASTVPTPTIAPSINGISPTAVTGGTTANGGSGSTTSPSTTAAGTTPAASIVAVPTVDRIVSITRTIDAGTTAVSAFSVPPGRLLVVTDVLVTNTGPTPVCGASVAPGGAGVSPTTSATTAIIPTTSTAATTTGVPVGGPGESGTGLLCVPAQTSLSLGLTTGLEFAEGQSVVLANASTATDTTTGQLNFHLRGVLVVPGA